jgi:hypothetical protein
LTCSCPAPGAAPTLGNANDLRFLVEFNAVASDPLAVEIVSRGCTNADASCDGGTPVGDARAVVRVQLKVVPDFSNIPNAALTTGSAAVTGGNLSVVNTDHLSNGITINSGTTVEEGSGTNVITLPGTPSRASILDADPSLSLLTNADADGDLFFQSFFGKPIDVYKFSPKTQIVEIGTQGPGGTSCTNATSCGAVVSAFYNQGIQQFWVEPDVQFGNANLPSVGTLGTSDKPIFLAGAGELELKANLVAYGMLYSATATATENWDYDGSGSGTVFGAMVSRGSFDKGSGTLNIVYDPKVFGQNGPPSGVLVRVPGSWRDKDSIY